MANSKLPKRFGGVPVGGTTGQVLKKVSGTDHDVAWQNESGGGSGSSLTYNTLTDAPATLAINNAYKLQATTLTANRVHTMPAGAADGDIIEIFNANTTAFEATLAGSAVYYWNEIDTLTTLDAGVYYKFLWLDGMWIIQNLT